MVKDDGYFFKKVERLFYGDGDLMDYIRSNRSIWKVRVLFSVVLGVSVLKVIGVLRFVICLRFVIGIELINMSF